MKSEEYAFLQEQRFSNKTGTNPFETLVLVQLPVFCNFFVVIFFNLFLEDYENGTVPATVLCGEFFPIILTSTLVFTVFSQYAIHLYLVLIFIILLFSVWMAKQPTFRRHFRTVIANYRVTDTRLSAVSCVRSTINFLSIICVLAADFQCFPERFLKTHAYGYSLMDTGVGLYIMANAFGGGSAGATAPKPCISFAYRTAIKKFTPVFVVGVSRYVATSLLHYHKQVSEYGVHWNFFITLSVLLPFNELFTCFVSGTRGLCVSLIAFLAVHEGTLYLGAKEWVLADIPRVSFVVANREGIVSLMGYEVLYLAGVIIKTVLPKKGDSYSKYLRLLSTFLAAFVLLFGMSFFFGKVFGVSRRLVNGGYIFWVISLITLTYWQIIVVELFLSALLLSVKKKRKKAELTPATMRAVNYNGLVFFLIGNLFTGLINLSMHTLIVSHVTGAVIIILYTFTCCTIVTFLYRKNIRFP